MKKLIFVGILIVAIFLSAFAMRQYFIVDAGNSDGGMPVLSAAPIMETNQQTDSVETSKNVFLQNYDVIMGKLNESPRVSEQYSNIISLMDKSIIMKQYLFVEKRVWKSDSSWIGDGKEEIFVIEIPLVSADDKWKYENGKVLVSYMACDNPNQAERVGEVCDSVEMWKETYYLKFLMNKEGVVYFAGG